MPFGMKNAPATFKGMMNKVIAGLDDCEAYIDDLALYSDSWDKHIKLREFFCRLRDAHLSVNLSKSEFCRARVRFFGHIVGQGEVAPVASKVDAIVNFPIPGGKREVMRFLGTAGYYWKFCCNFSSMAEPLTSLLQKQRKFVWTKECQNALEEDQIFVIVSICVESP